MRSDGSDVRLFTDDSIEQGTWVWITGGGDVRAQSDRADRAARRDARSRRRIWRKFVGEPERMIHELSDSVTTKYQDDVI